jgi:mannose-6-phosphate isomerase-like protein (cupin superfamily)
MPTRRWRRNCLTSKCGISISARRISASAGFIAASLTPDSVAEHDQISEVYHVLSGSATLVLGPDIVNRQRRPATMRTVVEFNGPGNNGSEVRDGIAYEIKAGDVVVIPAGTGHWFTRIEDHIDYLMVRIDPDKVTPLKSEAQSQEYLSKPAPRGE